jgi:hypothetical protein
MYLVGHAMVGFLIACGLSKKYGISGISFALVMLIGTLPDIDILLQSAGIVLHKTYTHSLILSVLVVLPILLGLARWKRVSLAVALVYFMAYVQHIIIGDIAVGSINILYPFGTMIVGSGIGYGTLLHTAIEFVMLAGMVTIVMAGSFKKRIVVSSSSSGAKLGGIISTLLKYGKVDRISYILLISSLIVSFSYLLYGIKTLPRLSVESELDVALLILLHISSIALVEFRALVSRKNAIETYAETSKRN